MEQYCKIAGLNVKIDSFGRTTDFAKPYMVDPPERLDIIVDSNLDEVKRRHPTYPEEMCEYLGTGKSFYQQLLNFDGMMLHSSAVIMDGKAYLFSAQSGTGKSTHTCLWRRVFGDDRVRILNDDKPALRLEDGRWYAYGTPWSGKTGQNLNLRVPLEGIAMLERGEQNEIEHYNDNDVAFSIYRQTSRPKEGAMRMKMLELLDQLITRVPIWKLKCNMSPEAAIVAYEAMSGEKWRN